MANQLNIRTFDYDDVRLVPGKNVLNSRSHADTSVKLGSHTFDLPVIPSNMSTIVDEDLAVKLASNNLFYVMHRFDVNPVLFTQKMHRLGLIASISLGIQKVDYEHVDALTKGMNPEYVTIDIAHGHSDSVIDIIKYAAEKLPDTFIIAGNVATPEAALELEAAGAHGIKIGIGPGSVCTTAPNTGFGTQNWQLASIEQVSLVLTKAALIADGGIRHYGDIAKSIAFGADMVMVGGMFAGHDENPGEVQTDENGTKVKVFFGSASEHQKGEKKHVEGKKTFVPYKGSIDETFRTIKENLQSSITYAGGTKLSDLYNTDYVIVNR